MRFIATSVVNAQGFTSEAKDVNLSLYRVSCLYIWGTFTLDVKNRVPLW